MTLTSAVVFLPREPGTQRTLMLEPIVLSPAARWLAHSLTAAGIDNFFIVCHPDDEPAARQCFPDSAVVVASTDDGAAARLDEFLSPCGDGVLVVTRPVFIPDSAAARLPGASVPRGAATGMYRIDSASLRAQLSGGADFEDILRQSGAEYGSCDWLRPITADAEQTEQTALIAQYSSVARLRRGGVHIVDPASTFVDPAVSVGAGSTLLPGAILRGSTTVGAGCEIGPNTQIRNCTIGDNTNVVYSYLTDSTIGSNCAVGPFAYMRPHCSVGDNVKVGDFVELKNSTIGGGTKISHLTYIGDSDVGGGVNFGCGTVTVNYDGASKFRTRVGDGAFIGCNVNLVAPVKVGDGAYIAAGSTVTDDVPGDSLAIARAKQTVKVGWAKRRRGRK